MQIPGLETKIQGICRELQGTDLNLTPKKRLGSQAFALYLITFSVLFLEVALTKVLSVMLWHHFTYMVISVALLGFGAAGSYLTTTGRVSKVTDPAAFSSRWSALYAISIPLCYAFMVRVNLDFRFQAGNLHGTS